MSSNCCTPRALFVLRPAATSTRSRACRPRWRAGRAPRDVGGPSPRSLVSQIKRAVRNAGFGLGAAPFRPPPMRIAIVSRVGAPWLVVFAVVMRDDARRDHYDRASSCLSRDGRRLVGMLELDRRVAGAANCHLSCWFQNIAYMFRAVVLSRRVARGVGTGGRVHVHTCSLDTPPRLALSPRPGLLRCRAGRDFHRPLGCPASFRASARLRCRWSARGA